MYSSTFKVIITLFFTVIFILQLNSQDQLLYGSSYYINNAWNNAEGGYLDVNGFGCQDNYLCVSTSKQIRNGKSNEWIVLSADGKQVGEEVQTGDIIHLQSAWNGNGGYLGTRGRGVYYPENPGLICVSTWKEHPSDGATSWQILGNETGQYIGLLNQLASQKTYLDANGFGCGGYLCISGSVESDRDNGTGKWRFQATAQSAVPAAVPSLNPCDMPVGSFPFDARISVQRGDRVHSGEVLVNSDNGKYFAMLTKDGRFTFNQVTEDAMCAGGIMLYIDYKEIWAAPTDRGTAGTKGYVELQQDGHLCIYTESGGYVWCAPYSKDSIKLEIDEASGCLNAWGATALLWSSCNK